MLCNIVYYINSEGYKCFIFEGFGPNIYDIITQELKDKHILVVFTTEFNLPIGNQLGRTLHLFQNNCNSF